MMYLKHALIEKARPVVSILLHLTFLSELESLSNRKDKILRPSDTKPYMSAYKTHPPSGCKEMRLSSFPDREQAGTEAWPFHCRQLASLLPAMQFGNLQSNNKPPNIVHHRMTNNTVLSEFCFDFVTLICFHMQSALKRSVTVLRCFSFRFMSLEASI